MSASSGSNVSTKSLAENTLTLPGLTSKFASVGRVEGIANALSVVVSGRTDVVETDSVVATTAALCSVVPGKVVSGVFVVVDRERGFGNGDLLVVVVVIDVVVSVVVVVGLEVVESGALIVVETVVVLGTVLVVTVVVVVTTGFGVVAGVVGGKVVLGTFVVVSVL